MSGHAYAMGFTDREMRRLQLQADVIGGMSERMLVAAGLAKGMRVLDAGCGPGGLSLMAARLVGDDGSVVGMDRDERALEIAERQAGKAGLGNVHFCRGEIAEASFNVPFDAVIGRLILIHVPQPAAVLKHLSTFVRPGGLIVFQDVDFLAPAVALPEVPLFTKLVGWIEAVCNRAVDGAAGLRMPATFAAAGLPAASIMIERYAGFGSDCPIYEWYAETLRTLLPAGEHAGLFTAAEVDIDTLAERVRSDAVERNAVLSTHSFVQCWTRKPVV